MNTKVITSMALAATLISVQPAFSQVTVDLESSVNKGRDYARDLNACEGLARNAADGNRSSSDGWVEDGLEGSAEGAIIGGLLDGGDGAIDGAIIGELDGYTEGAIADDSAHNAIYQRALRRCLVGRGYTVLD